MTNNFTKYQKIIDEFRGQVLNKDFETKFTAKVAHIPKTERFLIKMELKRLAGPCTRLIDLRGHVDGECKVYENEGRSHFLDDIAIKVFEENLAFYGKYTFGVYEAVTNTENNFRVIYQKEKQGIKALQIKTKPVQKVFEKTQYPAQLFKFGEYFNRTEERMNFSIALSVTLDGKAIKCNSSDISVNGCKFRIPSIEKISTSKIIAIRFLGLEEEFEFGSSDVFEYEVKNIQLIDNIQLVGVKRVYPNENFRDGFKQFLEGFIQGNKRRYKINLDNTISALQARNFEQYVLPKLNELPVFIGTEEEVFLPKYALTCPNNQNVFQYWQDEDKHSTLNFLLSADRIQRLKKVAVMGNHLLVYSFIHKSQDKYYFYTADEIQLKADPSFMSQFLGFAANKSHFAISTLSIKEINTEKANSLFTLSESLVAKNKYLNLPVSNENLAKIDSLSCLVVVNDITDEYLTKTYREYNFDNIEPSRIKAFGHKRSTAPIYVEELGINYKDHRQEARFKYRTSVDVTCQRLEWSAKSLDFSASGLKIEFENDVALNKGDIVYLSFPELQKVTSAFDLKALPYEVVRVNKKKTIINLRVYVEKHKHIGRTFFKALIDKNKDKLTPDEYALMVPSLAKPLRNIYSSVLDIPNLIVQTSGSRYKIEAIASGQVNGKLLSFMRQISDKKNTYNLYPLLNHLHATNDLMINLKKMHASDTPITTILYVAIKPGAELVENSVITKLSTDLDTIKLQDMFIKNALKTGDFLCLQLKLSRTDAPDMEYLSPELSYISSYAIHRGKQIEQNIWNVSGVVQVLDITKETLLRVKLGV